MIRWSASTLALRAVARAGNERRQRDFARFAANLEAGIHHGACPRLLGRACMCAELSVFRRWNDDYFRLPPEDRAAFYTAVTDGFLCLRHDRKRVHSAWTAFCILAKRPCVALRLRASRARVWLALSEERSLPSSVTSYLKTILPEVDPLSVVARSAVQVAAPNAEAIGLARMLVRLGALGGRAA